MKSDVAINVKNVTKDFHLPRHRSDSLKQAITQAFKPKDKTVDVHHALRGISFEVKRGEFFGVLGRNGSGKSTLLKIISEIYRPSSGKVTHNGSLVSFIELGVGFKAELTGRENIYLNGALLGFSKKEIDERYDEIVAFAELEDFMEQKLKNYSSGMKVRLAFAVAIQAQSDILILDEVLAVGDAAFQRKCYDYFKSLKMDKTKTIVFVTHSMGAVKEYCDKAVLIEDGHIIHEGDASVVADEYTKLFDSSKPKRLPGSKNIQRNNFEEVKMGVVASDDEVSCNISLKPKTNLNNPVVALLIYRGKEQVYRWVSDEKEDERLFLQSEKIFKASLCIQNIFPVGKYTISLMVRRDDREVDYGVFESVASFEVKNNSGYPHQTLWRPKESFRIIGADKSA